MPQEGSIMIVFTMVVGILLIVAMQSWHATIYSWQGVQMRKKYTVRQAATQGLLMCGVSWCKLHYTQQKNDEWVPFLPHTISVSSWPCGEENDYSGALSITQNTEGYGIQAFLMQDDKVVHILECQVKIDHDALSIQAWR